MWTREGRPAKSPGLSRDQIVRAAMEILDAEGVDALSMRRLGAKLGSGATSLYWHIAHKDELMELVMDEVYGKVDLPDPEVTSWEDMASILAYGLRAAFVGHPWVIPLVGTMPSLGPNAMRMSSLMLRAFERAGFTSPPLDYAVSTLLAFVLGWTGPELAWRSTLANSGMSGEELDAAMMKTVRQAARNHPDILERFDDYRVKDPDVVRAIAFDFGLTCLLDGLRVRLAECRDRAGAGIPDTASDAASGVTSDTDRAPRT
ncbi:TetR family transcriptional regulator [Planobispora takensis]|uniref:TetR family transcriptional regulator n=1 Tax=Planobispora takensis TaxID=1367882 RepID=A0A8J3WTE8_9ACTN|nr:TetR family transcriptional regulator [Planobispora takensis]